MALSFNDSFWTQEGRSLQKPDLACLRQDASTYRLLLCQPKEEIAYDKNGIWMANRGLAAQKFRAFFIQANACHAELAVSPEYSCPWEVLRELFQGNNLPDESNVWVIGCHSISAKDLKSFTEEFVHVCWIYERKLIDDNVGEAEKFLDPVLICFKTRSLNNEVKIVAIVQFKTVFFGGNGFEWERDGLIKGETIYVVDNKFASTRLVTIICSDTLQKFDFNKLNDGYFLNLPLLLIHVQLNKSPFHQNYKDYRIPLFSWGDKNRNKEVITLNWARNLKIRGSAEIWNLYGGSAIYLKSDKLDTTDERLNMNQRRGLYFTNWLINRSSVLFFNYDEYLFLLENTKPSQENADPTQRARTGPKSLHTYAWDGQSWSQVDYTDGDFSALCSAIQGEIGDISCIANNDNFLNTERLIELSSGNLQHANNWYQAHKLNALLLEENELNHRVTFSQEPDALRAENRKRKVRQYATLKHTVLTNPKHLPGDLVGGVLKYDLTSDHPDRFLINIHVEGRAVKGTGVLLELTTPAEALGIRNSLRSLFSETHQGKWVNVWYHHLGQLLRIGFEGGTPTVNENTSTPFPSILKKHA
jgi:hypothetical protein